MENNTIYDVIVVGGGVVGLASAYKIQKRFPRLKVLLLEKESQLAPHQTGNNSGVIHSGLYYKPGSYKAKNCVDGRRELVAFAKEYNVAHDVCGKIVVAVEENELPFMDKIFNNGLQNGVEGIEKIGAQQIREIEPHCTGIAGIWVPCTGIIDYRGLTVRLGELIPTLNQESKVLTNHRVKGVERGEAFSTVYTNQENYKGRNLVFCAGLQSDWMAKMDGVTDLGMRIVGFRGDYYELTEQGKPKVRNLIYPVPNPAFPFLGVHFTRMTNGEVECGPNAVFTFKREGYGKFSFSIRDTMSALSYRGTWKLFFRHWRQGIMEYRRALSKRLFLKTLQRLVPSLTMDDIHPGRSGVRAMALDRDGNMIDDFHIRHLKNSIHVLNAPSPAATASLAIGTEVCNMAEEKFTLKNL